MRITAGEVRKWAREALEQAPQATESAAYYIINDELVYVAKSAYGSFFGCNMSFDELENGDIVAWFNKDDYNLTHEADELAKAVNKWVNWNGTGR